MEKVTAEAVVVKNPPLSGSVSEEKEKEKSHNWQKEMDAMLDKAYKESISSFVIPFSITNSRIGMEDKKFRISSSGHEDYIRFSCKVSRSGGIIALCLCRE